MNGDYIVCLGRDFLIGCIYIFVVFEERREVSWLRLQSLVFLGCNFFFLFFSRFICGIDEGYFVCIWWVGYLACLGGFESRNYYNVKMFLFWFFIKLRRIFLMFLMIFFFWRWFFLKLVLSGEVMVRNWVKFLLGLFCFNVYVLGEGGGWVRGQSVSVLFLSFIFKLFLSRLLIIQYYYFYL